MPARGAWPDPDPAARIFLILPSWLCPLPFALAGLRVLPLQFSISAQT